MDDLALQIAQLNRVEIHQAHGPDACGGEVKGDGGAQTSHADHEDTG